MKSRVTGNDIVLQTARLSAERGYRLFLLAGRVSRRRRPRGGPLARAGPRRRHRWGHTRRHAGPFPPPHDAEIVTAIQAARPHALFVAFGAPRQDEWIARHPDLGVPLSVALVARSTSSLGRRGARQCGCSALGLEWAHRLISEPVRLWRRYLIDDLPLVALLLLRRHRRLPPREETHGARGPGGAQCHLTSLAWI